MKEKLLYVALDQNDKKQNLFLADQLSKVPGNFGFKVNLDHFLEGGYDYIEAVQERNKPVFVDIKINNGSRTMGQVFTTLAKMGVSLTNVWAFADRLITPALEQARAIEGSTMKVLGVTITTRMDDDYCQRLFNLSMKEAVRRFTQVALEAGCDGIILPGTYLDEVKEVKAIKLVSGIRPEEYQGQPDAQKQVVTPSLAINSGADILVCGSPIYKSENPVESLQNILLEMSQASL